MWYVYILKDADGRIYIGSTNDLRRRISEHKARLSYSTRTMNAPGLEAYNAVKSENIARRLEKYFKAGSGNVILKKRILADEV